MVKIGFADNQSLHPWYSHLHVINPNIYESRVHYLLYYLRAVHFCVASLSFTKKVASLTV